MKNLTPELIAKAKAAESAEELLEIAKANGVELTAEEVKTYFEQIHANSTISDDDLTAVTGGGDCFTDHEDSANLTYGVKDRVRILNGNRCPKCHSDCGVVVANASGSSRSSVPYSVMCTDCSVIIMQITANEQIEVL